MKKKQKEELKTKSIIELVQEVEKRVGELTQLEMEIKLGRLKNTSSLNVKKDELAVIKTILQEKRSKNENN